jgi:hypothetical protein
VERLSDKSRIVLKRPANLNNGIDFEIRVEGTKFIGEKGRRTSRPSHWIIYQDLLQKQKENPKAYDALFEMIERVYNCNGLTKRDYSVLRFKVGMPVDMLLLSIKWLLIEQDLTYWNYSGRARFMSGVPQPTNT